MHCRRLRLRSGRRAAVAKGEPVNVDKMFEGLHQNRDALAVLRRNGVKVDVVFADGSHRYWSTHCRHDRHDACAATELAPGVPRQPSQCKTCAAPCLCPCHTKGAQP